MTAALGQALNLQGLFIAVPLVALVLLLAWMGRRSRKRRAQKPGQLMRYTVPGKTAAACVGLLNQRGGHDVFGYTLEGAKSGGWYIHFTAHLPTGQPLDTVFLITFEGEAPAVMVVRFVREAFGSTEPVMGEALLDGFFAGKLGAERAVS